MPLKGMNEAGGVRLITTDGAVFLTFLHRPGRFHLRGGLKDNKIIFQFKNSAGNKLFSQRSRINRLAEKHCLQKKEAVQFHGKEFHCHAALGNSGDGTDSMNSVFDKKT